MDDTPRDSSNLEKRLEEAIARQQAQLDAFIEETENKLSELESSIEEVRGPNRGSGRTFGVLNQNWHERCGFWFTLRVGTA
jgi:hypothetical protein